MMKEQFLQQVYAYIHEQQMIGPGDTVFAGVSGGADSMCLLEVLFAYQKEVDFNLRVIHVEHGIRGADSVADAQYVQAYCLKKGIPCEVVTVDALSYSKNCGCSVEEAARELRYRAFEQAAEESGEDHARIAVAHHMEDQAETVLWQWIRGSDIKGMGGMRPVRGRIIRPLLASTRGQIEEYLKETHVSWREDATNSDDAYTRNRLRREVLPVLTDLNEQAVAHLCESAARLQEAEYYLEQQTELAYDTHVVQTETVSWRVKDSLLEETPFLQRRVLHLVLQKACKQAKDLTAKHVRLLQELFFLQTGRELNLPYEVFAWRTYHGIELFKKAASQEESLTGVGEQELFHMEVLDRFDLSEISKKKYTKWFDYDKIKYSVQIRRRQSGDFLVVDDAGHSQKLKKYLVNEKIPAPRREELLLLADGSHVMWVVGYRISSYYKVDGHTKRVLKVQYDGGNEDG